MFEESLSPRSGVNRKVCRTRNRRLRIENLERRQLLTSVFIDTNLSAGATLTTYRLAIATTGEFTQAIGGKAQAEAFIDMQVALLNELYGRELAIQFELVSNNSDLVFTEPATDPYSTNVPRDILDENQAALADTNLLGLDAFDIGHVLTFGSSGGVAQLGGAGAAGKARGASGSADPANANPSNFLGLIGHEIGHQFDANHSFSGMRGNCGPNIAGDIMANPDFGIEARQGPRIEPGSGTTLMGYAGLCGDDNLAQRGDSYFHAASFHQIRSWLAAHPLAPDRTTVTGNQPPTVDGGADFTIPVSTPFTLTATANDDGPGDRLTYSWEQFDVGPIGGQTVPVSDAADDVGPLFRSFEPTSTPSRTFPRLSDILDNVTSSKSEKLPTQARDLNFRVTARDNNVFESSVVSGIASDDVKITVVDVAGSFRVSSFNSASTLTPGSTQTITWDTAGTQSWQDGTRANVDNVQISMSTNGGLTFPHVIAESTSNDGSASITVPNINSTAVRFKVAAIDNIFFDISNSNQTITANPSFPGLTTTTQSVATWESGGTAEYSINLNTAPTSPIQVTISGDSQAMVSVNGTDFAATQIVTLSDTSTRTITVKGIDDNAAEGPHHSRISHSIAASGDPQYPIGAPLPQQAVLIIDDELAPVVGVDYDCCDSQANPMHWIRGTGQDISWDDGRVSSIDFSGPGFPFGGNLNASSVPHHIPSLDSLNGYYSSESTQTFTFSDLPSDTQFRAYVFSLVDPFWNHGPIDQTVSIVGQTTDTFVQNNNGQVYTLWVNGEEGSSNRTLDSYGRNPITADAQGRIQITVSRNAGAGRISVAGLALQEVPPDSMTGTGFQVVGLQIGSSAWSESFRTAVDPQDDFGFALPITGEPQTPVPWSNVNRVRLIFSQDVGAVNATMFEVTGTSVASYGIVSATPSGRAVILELNQSVGNDRVTVSVHSSLMNSTGGALEGGTSSGFSVLPGDVNRSGRVAVDDVVDLRNGLGTRPGRTNYSIFGDTNGSGVMAVNDLGSIRNLLGQGVPAVPLEAEPLGILLTRDRVDSVMESLSHTKIRNRRHEREKGTGLLGT